MIGKSGKAKRMCCGSDSLTRNILSQEKEPETNRLKKRCLRPSELSVHGGAYLKTFTDSLQKSLPVNSYCFMACAIESIIHTLRCLVVKPVVYLVIDYRFIT